MLVLGFVLGHVGPEVVTTVSNHCFLGYVKEVVYRDQGGPQNSLSCYVCVCRRRAHGPRGSLEEGRGALRLG